jgi:hypothetical protein
VTRHDHLARLIEDIALAPAVETGVRHDLLAEALAPLGPVDASREADAIEAHAYWVRTGPRQGRSDLLLHAEVDVAVHRVERALDTEAVAA